MGLQPNRDASTQSPGPSRSTAILEFLGALLFIAAVAVAIWFLAGKPIREITESQRLAFSSVAEDSRQAEAIFNYSQNLSRLWPAIVEVESGGNLHAVGRDGELGPMQIRPIMVEEVNRIARRTNPALGSTVPFSLEDRTSLESSVLMFRMYSTFWADQTQDFSIEGTARRWNGGPTGHMKDATLPYWKKVQSKLK